MLRDHGSQSIDGCIHRIISNGATSLFCYRIVMTWIVPLLFLRSYSEKDEEKIPDYRIL